MARYDLYADRRRALFVDVRATHVELDRLIVIPLQADPSFRLRSDDLTPELLIDTNRYRLMTHLIASVPITNLRPTRTNIAHHRDAITRALDTLLTGF